MLEEVTRCKFLLSNKETASFVVVAANMHMLHKYCINCNLTPYLYVTEYDGVDGKNETRHNAMAQCL
jgi:hypothetical protein